MKAITIKQPWASLIVEGVKDIENRTWQTKYRGRVLVHAAKTEHKEWFKTHEHLETNIRNGIQNNLTDIQYNATFGCIIGSVDIIDCGINNISIWAEKSYRAVNFNSLPFHEEDEKDSIIYNWILANPIKFHEPIPVKGKLSFWDYPNILAEQEEKGGELFCHCQLSVKEENQVMRVIDHYRCRYCGGRWYK